jgi:hypothetical protein
MLLLLYMSTYAEDSLISVLIRMICTIHVKLFNMLCNICYFSLDVHNMVKHVLPLFLFRWCTHFSWSRFDRHFDQVNVNYVETTIPLNSLPNKVSGGISFMMTCILKINLMVKVISQKRERHLNSDGGSTKL